MLCPAGRSAGLLACCGVLGGPGASRHLEGPDAGRGGMLLHACREYGCQESRWGLLKAREGVPSVAVVLVLTQGVAQELQHIVHSPASLREHLRSVEAHLSLIHISEPTRPY
eukprot:TRINITY_DN19860_c0_g1_i2.p1 TRINITY_DN19860_c0_g1~~TRINITY_DN19860_c0_g1_i2.p1  ORF type:complete len:112 (+),score=12.82 TRINITY_DN19860_c0_g1_i2:334-669(+)